MRIQWYHTYLCANMFSVVTDHKPLVSICTKPLHSAPYRLQCKQLKIQGYHYRVIYRPGGRCTWSNGYRRRNWTRRHEFITWTRLIAFHIALIPLGKVWIQLFSHNNIRTSKLEHQHNTSILEHQHNNIRTSLHIRNLQPTTQQY